MKNNYSNFSSPAVKMTSKSLKSVPRVSYQNRVCDQKNVDIIVSQVVSDKDRAYKKYVYKLKYPTFSNNETLHSIWSTVFMIKR